ncbi:MAG: phosphatase PAP2 family protein [Clostridia bacterium]|nr:phosphatase PAP2 family protein [Clostridia bacterium]
MDAIYTFDYSVLNWIQENLQSAFTDGFMSFVTHFGDGGVLWIGLSALFLCFRKTRKAGFVMGLALFFGLIVGNVTLKPLIARVRPYENAEYADLIRITKDMLLIKAPVDYSFPSGHSLSCFEASVGLFICNKKIGTPAIILAVFVAFSRLYLYVHYFTDVAVGAVLGTGFAIASYFIVNALEPKVLAAIETIKESRKV